METTIYTVSMCDNIDFIDNTFDCEYSLQLLNLKKDKYNFIEKYVYETAKYHFNVMKMKKQIFM